jgi:peptidyl-tRNA hydrolase, PTH2 family
MSKFTQYVIVRTDLKMSHGKMAAQVAHASLGSVLPYHNEPSVQTWLSGLATKIVLKVKNYSQLRKIGDCLVGDGIIHKEVWDACSTEIQRETEGGTLTCIGVIPLPQTSIPKYIKRLQLYV